MTRIETEIKAAEGKQTEAETVIDALYKEIKDSKAKMAAGAKAPEIVQMQADIAAREKKIDDQKDIVRVAMEEKRKAEQEKKLIEESMKEQLDEIANMTA
jgi:predicted  nucleic acid-binding Zn-ribbon protein